MGGNGTSSNGNGREQGDKVDVPLRPIPWVPKRVPASVQRRQQAADRGRRSRRTMWVLAAFVAVGLIGIALGGLRIASLSEADTIDDEEFVRRADDACIGAQRRVDALEPVAPDAPDDVRADGIDDYVAELERLVATLDGLEVAAPDRDAVDRWLDSWSAYNASGRRFADALRAGDTDAAAAESRDSRALSQEVGGFALGNGMADCIIRAPRA